MTQMVLPPAFHACSWPIVSAPSAKPATIVKPARQAAFTNSTSKLGVRRSGLSRANARHRVSVREDVETTRARRGSARGSCSQRRSADSEDRGR